MTNAESSRTQVLAVGLPRAGKTTFIAALWHVLQAEDVPGALRLSHLSGDARYLNAICSDWRQYREVAPTHHESEQLKIMMSLTDGKRSNLDLVFPDLAGETFRQQWTDRQWSMEFEQLALQASGLLVFVHPRMIEPLEIYEVRKLLPLEEVEGMGDGSVIEEEANDHEQALPKELEGSVTMWEPAKAAEQVQLVDILQFLFDRVPRRLRVSLVISAWDLLKVTKYTLPVDYLKDKVAFLHQFLSSNPELQEYKVFGVSAIGGDLEDSTQVRSLQEVMASERIQVVTEAGTSNDITEPIKWALSWHSS